MTSVKKTRDLKTMVDSLESAAEIARARSIAPGVWSVRSPTDHWCVKLVSELRDQHPQAILWVKTDPRDLKLERLNSSNCCRKIPAALTTDVLLQSLYEGGWAIFFGDQALMTNVGVIPELLPTNATELRNLMSESHAEALIVSWYDDAEWLLVSKIA